MIATHERAEDFSWEAPAPEGLVCGKQVTYPHQIGFWRMHDGQWDYIGSGNTCEWS
jgi:hypothetical protein